MVYSAGLLLVTLTSQLHFSALLPAGPGYYAAEFSASATQPLPFAPEALAYHFPAPKAATTLSRELYSPRAATDSSALLAEGPQVSENQDQGSAQNGLFRFWDSVSEELGQAWRSIRMMFR